jgi:hypothetical protein
MGRLSGCDVGLAIGAHPQALAADGTKQHQVGARLFTAQYRGGIALAAELGVLRPRARLSSVQAAGDIAAGDAVAVQLQQVHRRGGVPMKSAPEVVAWRECRSRALPTCSTLPLSSSAALSDPNEESSHDRDRRLRLQRSPDRRDHRPARIRHPSVDPVRVRRCGA